LKEGCTLKILSKEGDQKGWWKGQIGDKVIDFYTLTVFNNFKTFKKYIFLYLFSDWIFSKSLCTRTFTAYFKNIKSN